MKYFAVVLVALIAAAYAGDLKQLTEEQRQGLHNAALACLQQEQLAESVIQQIRQGNLSNTKCFVNCYLQKLKFFENGAPNETYVKNSLEPIFGADKVNQIQQQCNGLRGADKCDTALKLYECYYKQNAAFI